MTFAQLKELKEAQPFRPLLLRTADGREFSVPHEDFIWLPAPTTVFVVNQSGTVTVLDSDLIASVEIQKRETPG